MSKTLFSSAIVSGLISIAFVDVANADTGLGYLACEAGSGTPSIFAVSPVFSFDYDYHPNVETPVEPEVDAESEDWADEWAAHLVDSLAESEDRSEQFKPPFIAVHGAEFQERVVAQLGFPCVSKLFVAGPGDTMADMELQRDITDRAWIDTRREIDGLELEWADISYEP